MATISGSQVSTRLSDLPVAEQMFTENVVHRMLDTNAFVSSGVMVRDPELDAFLTSALGGKTISPRFLGPLANDEENISSDNPAEKSTPKKFTGGMNTAVRQNLNQSWSSMDLNAALLGIDPMGAIRDQVSDYWSARMTARVLASLKGVVASDLAETGGPVLTVDVTSETGAAALFNANAFLDAKATMGDRAGTLTTLAVHSVVYTTMQKLNLIDFQPHSEALVNIPTYMGLRVIVDDAMTYEPASGSTPAKYYSYLFGAGAVALGVGEPKTPFEVYRDPAAGNGEGEEVLHSRVMWVIHPQGYSFGLSSTPTPAQLATAANWTRNFERKRIPLAALVTQG